MSQSYEHACQRAELLGLPIPSEEEWKETVQAQGEIQQEDEDDAAIQELDNADEAAQRISGGLDELNSILNATQKKINRFKNVCSSLGTLLKVKVGSQNNTTNHKPVEQSHPEETAIQQETQEGEENLGADLSNDRKDVTETSATVQKKKDLNESMGSHLNKLDSLITKAENAQYSMQHQTKQMRKFLK